MITRTPILTSIPVAGQYRYRDLLQILPPNVTDPRPDSVHGWYGATLAVAFDERAAPGRLEDHWAHDHRERSRIQFLTDQVEAGLGSRDWLDAAISSMGNFSRRRAIEHEALRLLQVLANTTLRRPALEHDWYLDRISGKPIWAQPWYPSFVTDQWGEFWSGDADAIPLIEPKQHFERTGIGPDDTILTLPSDIDTQLNNYFALTAQKKITYARVCELFANGQEIWPVSRSLSLVSYVFAIDALCHVDDPEPARCPDCQNLLSDQICSTCGGPRFGLTRRFREFVEHFLDDRAESKFAAQLFIARSDIAHRGELLRADQFDAGFNTGGSDDQSNLERGVGRIVRKVLLGWLSERGRSAT